MIKLSSTIHFKKVCWHFQISVTEFRTLHNTTSIFHSDTKHQTWRGHLEESPKRIRQTKKDFAYFICQFLWTLGSCAKTETVRQLVISLCADLTRVFSTRKSETYLFPVDKEAQIISFGWRHLSCAVNWSGLEKTSGEMPHFRVWTPSK